MSVKGFESLKRQVNLLLYHIAKSPGAADAAHSQQQWEPAVKPYDHVETLENLSLDNILLQEKKILALLLITHLTFVDLYQDVL